MDLFETLAKRQRHTPFSNSEQMRYFLGNAILLNDVPYFSIFQKAIEPFDVIRANIIIKSLINKKTFEKFYFRERKEVEKVGSKVDPEKLQALIKEKCANLPHIEEKESNIFLPIFSRTINQIYNNRLELLINNPYKILLKYFESAVVDPFDTYGVDVFDSSFTNLILLKRVGDEAAFYDKDSLSIFFVNNQGRLNARVALFDKDCHHPNYENIRERTAPVVDAFFDNDRERFIKALVDNKFISSRFLSINTSDNISIDRRFTKHVKK